MASRILSIEIGRYMTRILEMSGAAKNARLLHMSAFETPQDVVADGMIQVTDEFVALMKTAMRQEHMKAKKAYFVMNSSRIANREVVIPEVKDNRIRDLLYANASEYFPVDLEQYQLVHEVIEHFKADDGGKIRLSVLALPKDIVRSYEALAAKCSLEMEGLSYSGMAVKQMMRQEMQGELYACIYLDEGSALFTVMEDGNVRFQRNVNYGLWETIEAVQGSGLFGESCDAVSAEVMMAKYACISPSVVQEKDDFYVDLYADRKDEEEEETGAQEELDPARLKELQKQTADALGSLIGSLSRLMDYYQSRNTERKLEKVYLSGPGASCRNLRRLLASALNCRVSSIVKYNSITIAKDCRKYPKQTAAYFLCIGAPQTVLDLTVGGAKKFSLTMEIGGKKKLADTEEKADTGSWTGPILIFGLCLIGAAVLAAYGYLSNQVLQQENVSLNQQLTELTYINEVENDLTLAEQDNAWATAVDNATHSNNDELVAFIEELEEKMPSEIIVLTLSASETTVSLNVQVESKTAAADVIMQLRTFDSIDVSSVSTITDVKDDEGNSTVSFSVECNYLETAAAAEDTEATEETTESDTDAEADSEDTDTVSNDTGASSDDTAA